METFNHWVYTIASYGTVVGVFGIIALLAGLGAWQIVSPKTYRAKIVAFAAWLDATVPRVIAFVQRMLSKRN